MFRRHYSYPYSPYPYMRPPIHSAIRPTPMPYPSTAYTYPQEMPIAEFSQLDRLEREVIELNKRVNNLSRRLRRLEDHLNIHD